ncbi:hypothetical protein AB1Y20_005553 [Prymnesium parvum]|uniref:WW domain-containing protein n=1 Tax=Prymnesium parvum TaxID=97485 RepID=A0AB34J6E1_PRYPA
MLPQAAIRGRLVRRWSARRIAEARNERLEREKEAARQLELTRLRHEQQAEFERALLDSEARQVKEAEEIEAARVKEEEERASAAAAAEAAAAEAAARRHDLLRQMQQLQEIIVSESGARQELGARVEELSRALEDAEARCAELQKRLADQQVAANRREAQLRAEVAKWREAAGLSEKREQQARQLAEAERHLLEVELCEKSEELVRYREKYLQLLHEQEHGIDRGSRESISAPQSSFFTRPRPWAALGASLGDLFSSQIGPLTRRGSTARGRDAAAAPSAAALRPVETEASTPAANRQSSRGADDARELRSPTLNPSRLDWSVDELTAEYVAYLGLDPTHDAPLLWIAEDAARAPLPAGWEVRRDPQGSAYYMNTYTGASNREHPRDEEFRQLVAQGRLEILHSGATSYAQSQAHTERRSVEQTLCSPASTTVRAAVACSPSSTGGSPEYSFQVFIGPSKPVPQQNDGTDDASMIRCLSAQLSAPLRARGLPHFVLAFELDTEAKPHYVRIVQPGRYVLFRSVAETSWLSFGDKQEELAAVIFSEGMSDVYTMELLLPRSLSRDHTPVARVSSATDSNGLLRLNERGKEDSLLVFTGRVDVVQSSSRNRDAYTGVRLSSPSTNSANLEIRLPRGNTAQSVRYCAPIAPVHAFCAALALAHWSSTEAKSGKKR